MPIHKVKSPDGNIIKVQAPEGASQDEIIAYAKANYKPKIETSQQPAKGGFFDNALDFTKDVAAQTGRMVVGGATGLAGILANPLNATVNMAGEALGYNPNLSTDIREQSLQQYDVATGNRGKPTDAAGRIAQAGGEALIGGGLVSSAAKLAKAPAAISEIFGINNVPSALAEIGAGAGVQTGMEVAPENPIMSQLIGGVAGAIAPQAIANAPRGIAKSLGINSEKVATLEQAGMPLNIPAVSDSNVIRSMSSASQNVIGGGKLKQSMDAAYKQAENAIKDLGYTGTTTPVTAGITASEGLQRYAANRSKSLNKFKKIVDTIIPPDSPVNLDDFGNKIASLAQSYGGSKSQTENILNNKAFQELRLIYDDAMQSHTRLSRLTDDELNNLQQYQEYDLGKLYDMRKSLMEDAANFGKQSSQDFRLKLKTLKGDVTGQKLAGLNDFRNLKEIADVESWARNTFAPEGVKAQSASAEAATAASQTGKLINNSEQQLKEINDAIALKMSGQAGSVPLSAIDWARTEIGSLISQAEQKNQIKAIPERAYGLLSELTNTHARNVAGKQGERISKIYNKVYSDNIKENSQLINRLLLKLGGAKGKDAAYGKPEAIIQSFYKGNSTEATNIMKRLNNNERDVIRDAVIYNRGGGDNFSIGNWANQYKKMDITEKKALFYGKENLLKSHDDLMNGVEIYKELGQFKNTSNTAAHNLFNQLITGGAVGAVATGFTDVAMGLGSGLVANKLFASIMASPKATKMLANILKSPPASENILHNSLIKTLKASGYTDNTAQQEIDKLLEEARKPLHQPAFGTPNNPQNAPIPREPLTLEITPQSYSTQMEMPNAGFTQQNEGLRTSTYTDTEGNPTIGYGFNFNSGIASKAWKQSGLARYKNMEKVKRGEESITPQEAQVLYQTSMSIAAKDAMAYYPDFERLSQSQQEALLDMSYQMGINGLNEFKGLKNALKKQDKNAIMYHGINSDWYRNDPSDRAKNNLRLLIKGM